MAENRVAPSNGIFSLGGTKDAEIADLDPNAYDVFTTDKDLAAARAAFPGYDWFTCFSVKDKQGNYANVSYTLRFNKPASGNLFYYHNGAVHPVQYGDAGSKGSQARSRATLNLGDPPIGMK